MTRLSKCQFCQLSRNVSKSLGSATAGRFIADEMCWCEAALREWKREEAVQMIHSCWMFIYLSLLLIKCQIGHPALFRDLRNLQIKPWPYWMISEGLCETENGTILKQKMIILNWTTTTRIPEMLGRFFFFFFIKWKLKDFKITWANILFTIEHREHNKCLNWEILHFYPLNELISNLLPATGLKKVGMGLKKPYILKTFSWDNI